MRYFTGFLISIGLVVLVVILVIRGLSGGGTSESQKALTDYANTDAVVQMTVDGPVIAEQDHRAFRITVGRTQVTVEALKGYQYETIENKFYSNNDEAYRNFLRAIDAAGFSRGSKKSEATDPRGACAKGNRGSFKILNGSSTVQNYWATTCRGQGNFKGNFVEVRNLFVKQIPRAEQRIVNQLGI